MTTKRLIDARRRETSAWELLRFFGVLILCTRCEFMNIASLWATKTKFKYVPPVTMGKTKTGKDDLSRVRSDDLWRFVRWSEQPVERPASMSSGGYRCRLVDDFVTIFNEKRAHLFFPSDAICVDESMSRWYGLGVYWINRGYRSTSQSTGSLIMDAKTNFCRMSLRDYISPTTCANRRG